jgi:hypothetical protein
VFVFFSLINTKTIGEQKRNIKESRFTSDIFLPYLSPSCPYACCNPMPRRSFYPSASAFSNYQKPRYSMPTPVNYQIVPIRHSSGYYRNAPTKSLLNLNTFGSRRCSVDENNNNNSNSNSRYGTLRTAADERRSPYYYNELTRTHANNQLQFSPINPRIQSPNHFTNAAENENFADFINSISVENNS